MKFKTTIFSLLIFSLFSFTSCSDDDDLDVGDANATACADFETAYRDAMAALSTFSENPTTENCESYKSAFLKFYEEFRDCSYWDADYQEAVDQVQGTDCSEMQ